MNQTDNFDIATRSWSTIQERNRENLHEWCDLAAGLQTVSGQWKASILIALSERDSSLPKIQRRLELASRRVLVRAMRELETDGLVSRSPLEMTAYSLTRDGAALVPILRELAGWNATRNGATD
ncbi:winged helix-turn-helix transcriptional regulator [Labrenzia sp. CE80]|uniref:winged helix-turn-helix transcriptional regulator n=1 Tax=Labrenzia sp. CE80 TaxID=1788986 RepID=UPI00129B9A53|nr:winged helix-turn-helix transcriptional regulator [Labrenzia sp. CE80]